MSRETSRWKPVSAETFQSARSSGQTVRLAHEQFPDWAQRVPEIQALWTHDFLVPAVVPSSGTTTPVSGSFDVERRGKRAGEPLKFDRYYYISLDDGSFWQSGPYKGHDYGHHLAKRPAFLDNYPQSSR